MPTFALCYVGALLIVAAISDGARYTIPNWISIALVIGFAIMFAVCFEHVSLWPRIWTALGMLGFGSVIFAFGLMGGGDVKLWSAVALWLGPDLVWTHLVLVALLGGLLGLGLLTARRLRVARTGKGLALGESFVPYGIPIAVGALLLLPQLGVAGV
jgi:prepilin peptidase CpaA